MTPSPAATPDPAEAREHARPGHMPEFAIVSTLLLIAAPILLVGGTVAAAFKKRFTERREREKGRSRRASRYGMVNASNVRGADHSISSAGGSHVKADQNLLEQLKDISRRLTDLSADPGRYELDADAVVDLNLARDSVDKLIHRVERILE